eukprot:IDg11904t1
MLASITRQRFSSRFIKHAPNISLVKLRHSKIGKEGAETFNMMKSARTITLVVLLALVIATHAQIMSFAADNNAKFYLNGKQISSVFDWRAYNAVQLRLNRGDVIGIIAKGEGALYGAIADLNISSSIRHCVTKVGVGPWRAVKEGGKFVTTN